MPGQQLLGGRQGWTPQRSDSLFPERAVPISTCVQANEVPKHLGQPRPQGVPAWRGSGQRRSPGILKNVFALGSRPEQTDRKAAQPSGMCAQVIGKVSRNAAIGLHLVIMNAANSRPLRERRPFPDVMTSYMLPPPSRWCAQIDAEWQVPIRPQLGGRVPLDEVSSAVGPQLASGDDAVFRPLCSEVLLRRDKGGAQARVSGGDDGPLA